MSPKLPNPVPGVKPTGGSSELVKPREHICNFQGFFGIYGHMTSMVGKQQL